MFELGFSKFLKEEMKLGIECRTNTLEKLACQSQRDLCLAGMV